LVFECSHVRFIETHKINFKIFSTEKYENLIYFIPGRRKSNTYLDVPFSSYSQNSEDEDEETVTLRTFSSSNKGELF
jgi:hypothetical protein